MLNGLKREELIATNSMLLHELYFDGAGRGGGGDPTGALAEAIARDFGSLARWRAEFVAMGKALGGGSGWVLLTPLAARRHAWSIVWAADHTHSLAGGTPMLALDMYEHAYHLDFGANAGAYVDAFMANIAWAAHRRRASPARAGSRKPHTVDTPAARRHARGRSRPAGDRRPAGRRRRRRCRSACAAHGARRPTRSTRSPRRCPRGTKALVYCAWGFEIGGDCAAKLRERGIDAVAVAGGIGTWRADGLPTEPLKEGDTT